MGRTGGVVQQETSSGRRERPGLGEPPTDGRPPPCAFRDDTTGDRSVVDKPFNLRRLVHDTATELGIRRNRIGMPTDNGGRVK